MPVVKSRREQYSEATRAALIAAATRRFATDGYAATGLEDVAADIQATRGAVYHHFSSKKALFEAVLEVLEGQSTERIGSAYRAAPDRWAGAMAALDAFLDQCLDPVYSRVVWREGPIAMGWHGWHQTEQKYAYGTITLILGEMLADGLLAPMPLRSLADVAFSAIGAAGHGLAEAAPTDQTRLRAEYRDVLIRMITGLRGDAEQTAT
ncbi:TetR/AcrR family transcriptional regulator [Actinokineospora auranticolor]|uniref:AcrR family transcriptional regulator n=1 Tax=Actinokineospora auranticolor TaxID=155976 RepID=A0A2S6GV98_9PSEU|nr:TetR/AcrR family transcriptional regulator [Actinokineospora auranticolor]PPK69116.1 AcrR family transcriptional regulator [Actinokineospora auranticolor]